MRQECRKIGSWSAGNFLSCILFEQQSTHVQIRANQIDPHVLRVRDQSGASLLERECCHNSALTWVWLSRIGLRKLLIFLFLTFLQDEMTNALASMRFEPDKVARLKDVGKSSNALLNRRKKWLTTNDGVFWSEFLFQIVRFFNSNPFFTVQENTDCLSGIFIKHPSWP